MAISTGQFETPSIFWTLFHVVGSLVAGIVHPLWGAIWAGWAGFCAARAAVGSGQCAMPISACQIVAGMASTRGALPAYAAAWALAGLSPLWRPDVVEILMLLAPLAITVLPVVGGLAYRKCVVQRARDRAHWVPILATVFGVAPIIVEQQAGIAPRPDGGVRVAPLPPAMAAKIGPGLDAQISAVTPHLMLDPASGPGAAALVPVDEATAARRSALATSGGLIATLPDGPTSTASPDPAPGPIVLSAEDLR